MSRGPAPPELSSVSTVAPIAAGLKMWRPCHARTYFDSEATAAAIAIPPSAAGSSVGRSTNSRICAVMSDDSMRHGRCEDALGRGIHPDAHHREHRERHDELERLGADQPEERQQQGDAGERREREEHEPVHRDAAEHGEDAVPDRREGR